MRNLIPANFKILSNKKIKYLLFAKAKKGDKVLIYTNAKKAILYDPVLKKIVEVAPLNLETSSPLLEREGSED